MAQVIQGFFIGGARLAPATMLPQTTLLRSVHVAAARPAPGPPSSFARPFQLRAATGRPPTVNMPATRPVKSGTLQRFGGDGSFAVDAAQIGLVRSGGKPLPRALLTKMEAAFGADFSAVRIHVGPQASRIGALAFTTGDDLYFAPGQYQPESVKGQQLIGHELTHVVQQRQGRVRAAGYGLAVVQDRALEAEADRLGMAAAAYREAGRSTVQRAPVAGGTSVGRLLQRSKRKVDDAAWEPSSDEESESDGEDEEEPGFKPLSQCRFVDLWQDAAKQGYEYGWWEGAYAEIDGLDNITVPKNARDAKLTPLFNVDRNALAVNMPNTTVRNTRQGVLDHAEQYYHVDGWNAGTEAAATKFAWNRQNYPIFTVAAAVKAKAQNGGLCVYCNVAPSAEVDHVYPIQKHWVDLGIKGASLDQVNDEDNLVGSCKACNASKNNRYLDDWRISSGTWAAGGWFPHGTWNAVGHTQKPPTKRGKKIAAW